MSIKGEQERGRDAGAAPPSTGILDGPGGEPDGAKQSWGVQGVGGGTSYPPLCCLTEKI